ncbi:MAG: DUF433 domain-containing protein [Candidatus Roseilinea sp.]|uniref:DUF433 domain-containing protein n=1 Tax=Candidatus Roseilinea sp. TaxID=2838777 RepID=UPI00404AF81F
MVQDWRNHIHSDTKVLRGKPVVKGTRLSMDFLLGLLAAGWTEQQILDSYPALTPDAVRAIFAFAADALRDQTTYPIPAATTPQ